jgi:flavorubredoxin
MKAVEIKPGIYWVGVKDWNLRDFHGYQTRRGSTYNAYLIIDEKVVLVDTVKSYLCDEMLARIASVIDPSKIDIVVSNHVEMDHSGSIGEVLKRAPQAELLTSTNGEKGLNHYFDTSGWNMRAVKSGEQVSLGKRSLIFTHIPLVHWPDSMVTYVPEDKLLIPNDAFGQHIAADGIFDDETPLDIVMEEAAKYYANIILPYGIPVSKAMTAIETLEFDMIAPSHGVIWRKHIATILDKYKFWTQHQHVNKAVVIYDTMWGSTESMAQQVKSEFENQGIPVILRSLKHSHISDVIVDVLEAKYIALGSATINNMILPSMGAFLTYMRGLKPENKTGFIFGSYGWNPKALAEVESALVELGWKLPSAIVNTKYRPQQDAMDKLQTAVKALVDNK